MKNHWQPFSAATSGRRKVVAPRLRRRIFYTGLQDRLKEGLNPDTGARMVDFTQSGIANFRELTERNKSLVYLLAPLLVLLVATIALEYALASQESYIRYVKTFFQPQSDSITALNRTAEMRARFLWLASCVALISSSLAAIVVSCSTMAKCFPATNRRAPFLAAAGLAVVMLVFISFLSPNIKALNFDLTLDLLGGSRIFREGSLQTNVHALALSVVMVSVVAAMFLLVAASSTVAVATAETESVLATAAAHIVRLKNVLYVGSIMLVTGIMNMGAWMRWPASLFRVQPEHKDAFTDVALGLTTFWGTTFTVVTIAAYVPTALYLRSLAAGVHARQHPELDSAARDKWLQEQGFTISVAARPGPVLAMAGPFIAGPLSAVFNLLGTQLTQ